MGKFEIYLDQAKKHRFRLVASNGKIIATSESYNSKRGCKNGITSIIRNAPGARIEEVTS